MTKKKNPADLLKNKKAAVVAPAKAVKLSEPQTRIAKFLLGKTDAVFGKEEKSKLSAKGQAIRAHILKSFGGYATQAAELMSILTGEKITVPAGDSRNIYFQPGICLVPLNTNNGHNYPVGQVMMAGPHGAGHMLKAAGQFGNNMSTDPGDFRAANEAEVKAFVLANEEHIVSYLNLVVL